MSNDDSDHTQPREDLIRYDRRTQEVLLGVIRDVLTETSKKGLPGDHHFYITFKTKTPGVKLSKELASQYPEDMTIVIQRQFWDLTTSQKSFEIGLTFSGKPEKLSIPYHAITRFIDPSVNFALQFEEAEEDQDSQKSPDNAMDDDKKLSTSAPETIQNGSAIGADIVTLDNFRKKT